MLLDHRYRWTPSTGGEGVCRVRAFQSPLGVIVILTAVPILEATVRLDTEFDSVIRALALTEDIMNLPGFEDASSVMWLFGFDSKAGPQVCRIQERRRARKNRDHELESRGFWHLDQWGPMPPALFEPYMDGVKLEDLLEVRSEHD